MDDSKNKNNDVEEKYHLITRNLNEIIGDEQLIKKILNKRSFKIYWGTAPTGKIHIGYFVPLIKIADFLKAGCKIKILFANLHAFLDNNKSSLDIVNYRTEYYKRSIQEMLLFLNVDISKIEFINGMDYQLTSKYTIDVYKLNAITTISDAKHASSEVVKLSDNPYMDGLLYPSLQALDEEYLDVDAQMGGVDQRKIFVYARDKLPRIGYKKRIHLINVMVSALSKSPTNTIVKMSASNSSFKIDILDSESQIRKKINDTYCQPGNIIDNSLLSIIKNIIFPILDIKQSSFIIKRKIKFGGNVKYDNYETLINDFKKQKLHPFDLKNEVSNILNNFLQLIGQRLKNYEFMILLSKAYDDS